MWLESLPESILDQKYRIERQLGEGAMGAVYKATHVGTTRPVALKVIVPQLAENQEFGQRFKREAEAAGRLNHPNVVNVTDFGVTQVKGRELAYLVMEYLEGQSLADYLKENPRPPLPFLLDVMEQTGLALDASHAAGIVHRDLKPSNIWLQPNHRGGYNVKVLDFGIAKVTNPTQADLAVDAAAVATMVMAPGGPDSSLTFAMADFASPSNLKTSAGTLLGTPLTWPRSNAPAWKWTAWPMSTAWRLSLTRCCAGGYRSWLKTCESSSGSRFKRCPYRRASMTGPPPKRWRA